MSAPPEIDPQEVGRTIRAFREQRKWTLRRLAKRCGIPYYQLSRIETGKRRALPAALAALALALEVTTDELLQGVKEALRTPRPAA